MRYISSFIQNDLLGKMVFITGPRQAGNTTLVKQLLNDQRGVYFNWDETVHRKEILARYWVDED